MVEPTWASVQVVRAERPQQATALKRDRPVGNDFVPESVSATVRVQVEAWPRRPMPGEQVTVVEVERVVTVSANPSGSVLAACAPSCRRCALIVCVPGSPRACTSRSRDEVVGGDLRQRARRRAERAREAASSRSSPYPIGADFVPEPVSVDRRVQIDGLTDGNAC